MVSTRTLLQTYIVLISLVTLLAFPAFAQTKIRIGISVPLSGGSASEGADLQRMLAFANKQLAHDAYDLIVEDDRCSDKQAVDIAHKLTEIDHVKYVLGFAC